MTVDARIADLLERKDYREAAELGFRELGPKIFGYLRSVLRDDELAADAYSVFSEHVWQNIHRFRGEAAFRTWAFRIAWNTAITIRQDAWRRLGRRLDGDLASRLRTGPETVSALRIERHRVGLTRLRAMLTSEEQTLLTLRIDQQMLWNEVAYVLSSGGDTIDAPALRKRFERLKERLRLLARDHGLLE
jgi:RNA polymerase sigma-70 factor (ECF subfamily)